MNKNLTKASQAKALHELAKEKSASGDFAYRLAERSLESHLDEIKMPKPPRNRVFWLCKGGLILLFAIIINVIIALLLLIL